MSIFSLFLGGSRKSDAERMQDAAHGRAVLGDLFGSSPYMREWKRQNKEIGKQYRKQEKELRKQWRREDEHIQRQFDKEKERYERRGASKYYTKWEADHRRDIQRERAKILDKMELERNQQVRNIGPTIKKFGSSDRSRDLAA